MNEDSMNSETRGNLRTNLTILDVLAHMAIWLLLSIVTLGIALFFWPYAAARFILDSIEIHVGRDVQVCQCQISIWEQLSHIALWFLITLLTAGIAYPFYAYSVAKIAINRTTIQ